MSLLSLNTIKHVGTGRATIAGSFEIRTSNGQCNTSGDGFTVARTAVGQYTINFNDSVNKVESIIFTAHPDDPADPYVVQGSGNLIDDLTGEISIKLNIIITFTQSTSDLDGNPGSFVSFVAYCKNTSV